MKNCRGKGGFTLLELMVAMTILVFLVVMLSKMLTLGGKSVERGAQLIETDNAARCVLDFIKRDLSAALFDPPGAGGCGTYALAVQPETTGYAGTVKGQRLFFERLDLQPYSGNGCIRLVEYCLQPVSKSVDPNSAYANAAANKYRYRLMRYETRRKATLLDRSAVDYRWWQELELVNKSGHLKVKNFNDPLTENVISIKFNYVTKQGCSYKTIDQPGANSCDYELCALDIVLTMLDSADAKEISMLWSVDVDRAKELLEMRRRIYVARMIFNNKYGYAGKIR